LDTKTWTKELVTYARLYLMPICIVCLERGHNMISVLIDLTQVAYVQLGMGIIIIVQLIGV